MGHVALRALPAFDTENPEAFNSHANLLEFAKTLNDLELAAKFNVSAPTIKKWKAIPLGYKPKPAGRPKKTIAPEDSPEAIPSTQR